MALPNCCKYHGGWRSDYSDLVCLKIERNCLRTQLQQAQERAEAAEGLLEAAWLQSGHPHFQTWYESLTPAQRGGGDA